MNIFNFFQKKLIVFMTGQKDFFSSVNSYSFENIEFTSDPYFQLQINKGLQIFFLFLLVVFSMFTKTH